MINMNESKNDYFKCYGCCSLIDSARNSIPEGQCHQQPPTSQHTLEGASLVEATQVTSIKGNEKDEVNPERYDVHVCIGNTFPDQTQQKPLIMENVNLPKYLGNMTKMETDDNCVIREKCQILSLSSLEHLALENIKKIDNYLNKEENKLRQVNTKHLLPQLKKEYRDLSSLVLKAQNCVDDIIVTLNYKRIGKKIEIMPNKSNLTSSSEMNTLTDCKQSLMSCLKCLMQIKSLLNNICTACKKEHQHISIMHPINSPSVTTSFSEKETFMSQSSTSTPIPNCPCCGSTTTYENSIFSQSHSSANRFSSTNKEMNSLFKLSSKDNEYIPIYKDKKPEFARSSLTNIARHICNGKIRCAQNSQQKHAPEKTPKLKCPITAQHRPIYSEGSLGFKNCNVIPKINRETQSLHTPERLTSISIFEDNNTDNWFSERILSNLHGCRENYSQGNISQNKQETKCSYTTIDITIESDDDDDVPTK